jgi:parallel beta-helix repeat protein
MREVDKMNKNRTMSINLFKVFLSLIVCFVFLVQTPAPLMNNVYATATFSSSTGSLSIQSIVLLPIIEKSCIACYFIDSVHGSDSNSGTQPGQPWKTFKNLNEDNMPPGTIVHLNRDSIWTERLIIHASGTNDRPIIITAYGNGVTPIVSNPADTEYEKSAIAIFGNNIIIENLHIQQAGTGIDIFSNNNTVRNNEISNVGIGIAIEGQYNLITQNYIHDTHMVHNDSDGKNDDWGANGIDILNSHNEISFNRFVNCEAPSYDYGVGGGALEIYQNGDYTLIHHNWSFQTAGFIEVSSDGTGSAYHVRIYYNVIINATMFSVIHISGAAGTKINDFRVENNSLIDLRSHAPLIGSYIDFQGTPTPEMYIFRNNIIYISDYYWVVKEPITHENNIYYFLNPKTTLGVSFGPHEYLNNPQFVNIADYDFHLLSISPAIDNGIDLNYTNDYDLNPVPINYLPDSGAFEYQGH